MLCRKLCYYLNKKNMLFSYLVLIPYDSWLILKDYLYLSNLTARQVDDTMKFVTDYLPSGQVRSSNDPQGSGGAAPKSGAARFWMMRERRGAD